MRFTPYVEFRIHSDKNYVKNINTPITREWVTTISSKHFYETTKEKADT